MSALVSGDYVLATKFSDGCPMDHFCVGYFIGMMHDRYMVVDKDGQLFRANGFRRCEKISDRVGALLVAAMPFFGDHPGPSVWFWRYHPEAALATHLAPRGGKE